MQQPSIMHVCTTVLSWDERGRPMYSAVQDKWASTGSRQHVCIKKASSALLLRPCMQQDRRIMACSGSKQTVCTTGARLGSSQSAAWRHHLPSLLGPCQQLRATATQLLLPCLPSPSCRSLVLPITHRSSLW